MRGLYNQYTDDDLWLIKDIEWNRSIQNIRESQFALGNGYLGVRGILEEMPYDALPGTYLAGIYDKMGSQVEELANLPNPINFKFTIEGQKLDPIAAEVVEHRRVLNMKKAVLARKSIFKDAKHRRYEYQSVKFISLHNKNIGVMQIALTALDSDCVVDVHTGIDTSVSNSGILSEGKKRHFRIRELGQQDKAGYLVLETLDKEHVVCYWSGFYYQTGKKKTYAEDNVFKLKLKKNQTVLFTKVFCVKHFTYKKGHTLYKRKTQAIFRKAFYGDFNTLLTDHIRKWTKAWKMAELTIKGTANLQQNVRFNIYHMMICAPADNGQSAIGARTLSAEGYRGHIFWDSEIFLLPFFIHTFPLIARNMLLYRYKRLDKARELAKDAGYDGAKFPWESAGSGNEETPEWARDINRKIVKVYTHKYEHHINADIAYGVYKYYHATGDQGFMNRYGYELMFELARFWASRVSYDKKTKKYDINGIIGPDEFHVDIDNNAFTNIMAKWTLITASKLFNDMKKTNSRIRDSLKRRINLKVKEVSGWRKIAANITLYSNKNGVIEQFKNYFKLKEVRLIETDENGLPILPDNWQSKNLAKTQLIKQGDVVMALYLLDSAFSGKTKRVNYDYYLRRTVHNSSLSASIYAIMACICKDLKTAYSLFNVSLRADISNIYGNTNEGIHAASLGGAWQAIVFGFCGLNTVKDSLRIDPILPRTWQEISFNFRWRKSTLHFKIDGKQVRIRPRTQPVSIIVAGKKHKITPGRWHVFKQKKTRERSYYI